jgi:hypothetical protein
MAEMVRAKIGLVMVESTMPNNWLERLRNP